MAARRPFQARRPSPLEMEIQVMSVADDHPIDADVRREIEARLRAIEAAHGVRILYACESGSRGWGFASPDSDYDVRFLYVQPLSWYLRVSPERDVIELPISATLDINGWELRKALGLLKKGNATLIEWLDSPVTYRRDDRFLSAIGAAARETWQPWRSIHHYVHMARGNYHEYLKGARVRYKKYLYVLRPLLAVLWIEAQRGTVPMRFQVLVDELVADPALRQAIAELLEYKRASVETEYGPLVPVLDDFITTQLARLDDFTLPSPARIDFSILDELLRETILRFDTGAGNTP
jgi:predicted nucleotidyltransferase